MITRASPEGSFQLRLRLRMDPGEEFLLFVDVLSQSNIFDKHYIGSV